MSTPPTQAEITEALSVIERATQHRKTYTTTQTRAMSKEQIADALEQNPEAFDKVGLDDES